MRGVESVGRCRYLHYRPGKRVKMRDVAIIGVASGAGARDPGCADGPDAVIGAGPLACLHHDSAHLSGYHLLRSPLQPSARADEVLPAVVDINRRAANEVQRCLLRNSFPVVVGGDHSCAIGTWSGVHAAAGAKGSLGLLWVVFLFDIARRGFTSTWRDALGLVTCCTAAYGITIDLDAVDPRDAPGVG